MFERPHHNRIAQVLHALNAPLLPHGQRAQYGEEFSPTLSAKLVPDDGKGFSARNLARIIRFAEAFPDEPIVATLRQQSGWSHFVAEGPAT